MNASAPQKSNEGFFQRGFKSGCSSDAFAIGSMFNKAYGQACRRMKDVLQYALTLEHLEAAFYVKGFNEAPIPAGQKKGYSINT
jgi:hypothetical protein